MRNLFYILFTSRDKEQVSDPLFTGYRICKGNKTKKSGREKSCGSGIFSKEKSLSISTGSRTFYRKMMHRQIERSKI